MIGDIDEKVREIIATIGFNTENSGSDLGKSDLQCQSMSRFLVDFILFG